MKQIERAGGLDPAKLSGERYFETLLEQAGGQGLLSGQAVERIQLECLSLLSEQAKRKLGWEHSSMRVEAAQDLLSSLLFTIGLRLKSFASPELAVEAMSRQPVSDLYRQGRKRLDGLIAQARSLHAEVLASRLDTPNEFYTATIDGGISGFFRQYDPEFGAHHRCITADYPTCIGVSGLAGVEFIARYLEGVLAENLFCARFQPQAIHRLLCGYRPDYAGLLINLYEPVVTAAIGSALVGADLAGLTLDPSDVGRLGRLFAGGDTAACLAALRPGAQAVCRALDLAENAGRYVYAALPIVAGRVAGAAETGTLDRVFLCPRRTEDEPVIWFSSGEKMDDYQYRRVLEEVAQCGGLREKLRVIREWVRSFADLTDLLLDAGLQQGELELVFQDLGPVELAALLQEYPQGLEGLTGLNDREQHLAASLGKYLDGLDEARRHAVIQTHARLRRKK